MTIPEWNISGILPPISPGEPGHSMNRSPYRAGLLDVVESFSSSLERRRILTGLLDYRAALHEVGLNKGFQWLDGSFLEAVEIMEIRSPRDVDVVTFFHLPDQVDQKSLVQEHPHLFEPAMTRQSFLVDAYLLRLGTPSQKSFVKRGRRPQPIRTCVGSSLNQGMKQKLVFFARFWKVLIKGYRIGTACGRIHERGYGKDS